MAGGRALLDVVVVAVAGAVLFAAWYVTQVDPGLKHAAGEDSKNKNKKKKEAREEGGGEKRGGEGGGQQSHRMHDNPRHHTNTEAKAYQGLDASCHWMRQWETAASEDGKTTRHSPTPLSLTHTPHAHSLSLMHTQSLTHAHTRSLTLTHITSRTNISCTNIVPVSPSP